MKSLDEAKKQLLSLRKEYTQRIAAIQEDTHHKKEPVEKDFAEQATQSENDDVLAALDDEAQRMVMRIDGALSRIEQGTYGICKACAQPISEQRLLAVPYAELCIDCAEKTDK